VFLKRGQKFPACPNSTSSKGHSTTWRMVNCPDSKEHLIGRRFIFHK
jgi:hypothetical protein